MYISILNKKFSIKIINLLLFIVHNLVVQLTMSLLKKIFYSLITQIHCKADSSLMSLIVYCEESLPI